MIPRLDRDPVRELSAEFAPNEVALALTLTQYAAEWWMSLAVSMSRRLPATWSALSQGTIDLGRAKLIDAWTTPLDDDLAGAVERKVLVRAGQQTTGQLRASLQRAVISADPAAAERRRAQAEKKARVELAGEDSGTAALSGHFLPAAQASAAWARISGMAEAMKGDGAGGGIDLLRAQVFVGLLLGTLPQPPGPADPGRAPGGPDLARHGAGRPGGNSARRRRHRRRRQHRPATMAPTPSDATWVRIRAAVRAVSPRRRTRPLAMVATTIPLTNPRTAIPVRARVRARLITSHGAGRRSRRRGRPHGRAQAAAR